MANDSQDVVEILRQRERHHKARLAYHQDQIARIQKAISALCDTAPTPEIRTSGEDGIETVKYPWSETISEIAEEKGQFRLSDLREALDDVGLPGWDDDYYGAIQGTLRRKVRGGELVRVKKGTYRVASKPSPDGIVDLEI